MNMKQDTTIKMNGLQVLQNSLTVAPGFFERADNVTISQDFMVTKRRGYREDTTFPTGQEINSIFDYQSFLFFVSQNTLFRKLSTQTAQAVSQSASAVIVVRKTAHGLRNADFIGTFQLENSDDFVAAFPARQVDFYGTKAITNSFTSAATRSANVAVVTKVNHGMQNGNQVTVVSSTLGTPIAVGTKTIAGVTANTFQFADTGPNQSGNVVFTTLDTFEITAAQAAAAGVASGVTAASYEGYVVQSGLAFAVSASGVRNSRNLAANGNKYFTTDLGTMKLERSDLPILRAGLAPGLDIQAVIGLNATGVATGPIIPNTQVAYKVVFGRKDANSNLVLGEPSESVVVRNALAIISSSQIVLGAANSGGAGFKLVTVTMSGGHGLPAGASDIYIFNASITGTAISDGTVVIATFVSTTVFTFTVVNAAATFTGFDWATAKSSYVTFSVPSEITSTEFIWQLYRTTGSVNAETLPEENYRLVEEKNLLSGELTTGFVQYLDVVDELLISSSPQLYTNPTVEGPLQTNSRPPRALDIALFKNFVFYANTVDFRTLSLALIAPTLIANNDTLTIGADVFIFQGNASNEPIGNESSIRPATVVAGAIEVTSNNHGFALGDTIAMTAVTGITGVTVGNYVILSVPTANTFRFGSGAAGAGTATVEGVFNVANQRFVKRTIPSISFTLSESISFTARALVKAVNRNLSGAFYSRYTSSPDAAPGSFIVFSKAINASTFAVIVSNSTASDAFFPSVPTSGVSVSDTQDVKPNALRVSKLNEPEAVPVVNEFLIGSQSAAIIRIVALRDALIVFKEDGIFRLNGDSLGNFTVTILDSTVFCKASNSVAVLNNTVFALTNQGVVQVTDTSVRISSRDIEPFFTSIIGSANIDDQSSAYGYESERLYALSTLRPNQTETVAAVVYVYNYLTNAWTTHSGEDTVFSVGFVSSIDDKLSIVRRSAENEVTKERKEQTKVDFSGQETPLNVLVASPATATLSNGSAVVTMVCFAAHGLVAGQQVTITNKSVSINSAMPTIAGIQVVESVISNTVFTFANSSAATGSVTDTLFFIEGISESVFNFSTTTGSTLVTVSTVKPNTLTNSQVIRILSVDSVIAAAFAALTDVTNYRSIAVVNSTTFTFLASNPAIATVSGTGTVSDETQARLNLSAFTDGSLQPQVGDVLVSGNRIYLISSIIQVSTSLYLLQVRFKYKQATTDLVFLHDAYRSQIRFSPIVLGDIGQLKHFSEFQCTFRNFSSCTKLRTNFSTDSVVSGTPNDWDFAVGGNMQAFRFGGWGSLPWGQFPWGGGSSIQREFTTRPATLLRQYLPKESSMGTFIQPILDHNVAGEPFELQSISVLNRRISNRTTK